MALFGKHNNASKLKHFTDDMIGVNMNFAASESYKTLRTNLTYSFPDITGCKIIGITSSSQREGKSLTSINLAFSLSEASKRVLLIEADMRLSSIGSKMKIKSPIGLSNLLIDSGLNRNSAPVKYEKMFVLLGGDTPPNPSELLESKAMKELVSYYSQFFDYIIIDLPPVLIVPDALVISKLLHGLLLVVRHSVTEKAQLADTIRQIKMVRAKIIGFVYNGVTDEHGSYYKHSKHNYYNNYYNSYYDNAMRSAKEIKKRSEKTQ